MDDVGGPVLGAIKAAYGTTALPGLTAGLVVRDLDGWTPAAELTGGNAHHLVDAAQRRWPAQPHVAVALLWRAYSLWLCVPAAFAWVAARRVPHLTAADVLVRLDAPVAPVRLGLRDTHLVSVLPGDPMAGGDRAARPGDSRAGGDRATLAGEPRAGGDRATLAGEPRAGGDRAAPAGGLLGGRDRAAFGDALAGGESVAARGAREAAGGVVPGGGGARVLVVPDEAALLGVLRRTLVDEHVEPVLDALQGVVRISRRLLMGSFAAGIAHAARHAVRVVPGASPEVVGTLLAALELDDLVDWSADGSGLVSIRRRTCCLAFTLPRVGFCGDCCCVPPSPGVDPGTFQA